MWALSCPTLKSSSSPPPFLQHHFTIWTNIVHQLLNYISVVMTTCSPVCNVATFNCSLSLLFALLSSVLLPSSDDSVWNTPLCLDTRFVPCWWVFLVHASCTLKARSKLLPSWQQCCFSLVDIHCCLVQVCCVQRESQKCSFLPYCMASHSTTLQSSVTTVRWQTNSLHIICRISSHLSPLQLVLTSSRKTIFRRCI